jgi:hypothetical protein
LAAIFININGLDEDDLAQIDDAYVPPTRKQGLMMV